jgi:hypothetical protein
MIWNFTCSTTDCENNKNPVRLVNAINPVTCSACYKTTDAVETNEAAPKPSTEE